MGKRRNFFKTLTAFLYILVLYTTDTRRARMCRCGFQLVRKFVCQLSSSVLRLHTYILYQRILGKVFLSRIRIYYISIDAVITLDFHPEFLFLCFNSRDYLMRIRREKLNMIG